LDRTDEFESKYNFHFEEANESNDSRHRLANDPEQGQHGIVHYSCSSNATTNVLRRKDETRKLKRTARQERKAAERKAKEEKLKRLKNAKREGLEGRLERVRKVLGHETNKTVVDGDDIDNGGEADDDELVDAEGHTFKAGRAGLDPAMEEMMLKVDGGRVRS
jgi:protein KRI1